MAIGPGFVPAQLPTGQKYFELPFNELLAGLSAKQDKFDKAKAADNLEKLIPEGGLRTQELRQGILSELETDVAPLREKLYKTGEVSPYEFEAIGKKYANDPRMTWLKQDAAIMSEANKLMAEGTFDYGLQNWKTQQGIDQLKWTGQGMVDSQGRPVSSIGEAYKFIAPENTQKWLMTKMKESVIPQVEYNLGIKNLKYRYDENGNVVGFTGIDQKGYKKDYSYDLIKSKLLDNSKGKSLATSMLESVQGDKEGPYYLENYRRKGVNVNEDILVSDILSSGFGQMFIEDTRDSTPIIQGSTGTSGKGVKTPEDKTPVKQITSRVATNPTVILGKKVNTAFQAEYLTKQSLQNTVETANNIVNKANQDYSKYGVTFSTTQENGKTKIVVNNINNVQSDADKVAINNFVEAENSKLFIEQNKLKALKKQEDLLKKKHGLTKDLVTEFKEKDPIAFDKSLEELGKELITTDVISSSEPLTALVMNLINRVSLDEKKEALKALENNESITQVGPFGREQVSVSEKFKKILEKNSTNSNLKNYLNEYNDILLNGVTYRNASTIPIAAEGTNAETTFYSTFGNLFKDKAKVSEFKYANKYGKLEPRHVEKILSLGDEIQNKIKNNVFISVDTNEGGKLVFDVKLDLGDKDNNGNTIFQTIEVPAEGNIDGANLIYQRQGGEEALLMEERANLSKRLEQNNDLYAEYPEIGTSLVLLPIDINTSTGILEKGTYNFILPDLPNQVLQPTSLNNFIKFKNMWQIATNPEQKMQVYNVAKNNGIIKAISDPSAYQTIQENFQ